MNETIQELINSPNYEDKYLGVELLHRTGSREFFIHIENSSYYIPYKWHMYITAITNHERYLSHYIIDEYCRKNNYWIYE